MEEAEDPHNKVLCLNYSVSSRPWVWAPAWAGLWPEQHTLPWLQGFHLQGCAVWFHVIVQDHQTAQLCAILRESQGRKFIISPSENLWSVSALKSPSRQCQIQALSVLANRGMLPVLWFMTFPNDSLVRFKVNLTLYLFSDRISVGFLAMFQIPFTSEMLWSVFSLKLLL